MKRLTLVIPTPHPVLTRWVSVVDVLKESPVFGLSKVVLFQERVLFLTYYRESTAPLRSNLFTARNLSPIANVTRKGARQIESPTMAGSVGVWVFAVAVY